MSEHDEGSEGELCAEEVEREPEPDRRSRSPERERERRTRSPERERERYRPVERTRASPHPPRSSYAQRARDLDTDRRAPVRVQERRGNLFHVLAQTERRAGGSTPTALAITIARDLRADGGLPRHFRERFGQWERLEEQQRSVGECGVLWHGVDDRPLYFLVVKERVHERADPVHLREALVHMRRHMERNRVHSVAMPRVCCGPPDYMEWDRVRALIEGAFRDVEAEFEILVYAL